MIEFGKSQRKILVKKKLKLSVVNIIATFLVVFLSNVSNTDFI